MASTRVRTFGLVGAMVAAVLTVTVRAGADPWPAYGETLVLSEDGTASMTIELVLAAGQTAPVLVPIQYGHPSHVTARGPAGVASQVVTRDGEFYLSVAFDTPLSAASSVIVACDLGRLWDPADPPLAHGTRRFTYRLLNLTGSPIQRASGTVVLPPGFVVTAVESVVPAVTESTSALPYALDVRDGRRTVTISRSSLGFGDDVEVTFRMGRRGPPVILLLILAVLGAAYLVRFRDLVRAV